MTTYLAPLIILLPWAGALLVWLVGNDRPRWQHALAVGSAAATAAAALFMLPSAGWRPTAEPVFSLPFGDFVGDLTLLGDGTSIVLACIAATVGSLTVIFSVDYMNAEAQLGRYYALVLLFIGSMCGLVLSGNLFFLFLFWEATAFCSYALISFYNDDPRAVAAGIKALIITQIGGVGLLAGVLAAAAYLPDLQINTLLTQADGLPRAALLVVGFGFLLAAAAKSAQLPLYMWLPDAMEAPTPVSALIHAATMVNAGVYLLARFYPALHDLPGWAMSVTIIGVTTALFAALRALTSDDLKRILAYSTVSQLGYMTAGIGIGTLYQTQFHLLSHALFKALLFLAAGAVIHSVGTRDIRRMGGLWARSRLTAIPFLVGAAALVGLPVLNGFWSKELLLEAALHHHHELVYGLLVLGAGLTALYTTRTCWFVFFAAPTPTPAPAHDDHPGADHHHQPFMTFSLLALVAGTLTSWLLAEPLARGLLATVPSAAAFLPAENDIPALISPAIFATWSTLMTLAVVAVGIVVWLWLGRQSTAAGRGPLPSAISATDDAFNGAALAVANVTRHAAAALQKTQTGYLAWNVVGILLALLALVLALTFGSL